MPIFDIILPILGGMNHVNTTIPQFPPNRTTLNTPTPPAISQSRREVSHSHTRKLKNHIITRQNFTIRIATLNCNGAPKTASNQENNLIWQYVQKAKIDVLFLIDHRCSKRNLEFLRHNGEHYLNKDIRLINSEITLLKHLNGRYGPDTSYHATVGGCAILTFGSLAHITFPTTFSDPSGANTFIGAKLQYHSSNQLQITLFKTTSSAHIKLEASPTQEQKTPYCN